MELHIKYRPRRLEDVAGQPEAVKVLRKYLKSDTLPHAILFTGESGTGKTTMARILAERVAGKDAFSIQELDCAAVDKPMETIRAIKEQAQYKPMGGRAAVWIMDEFQALSRAGFTQQACLTMLEKEKGRAYFFLCTTDPPKIIPTVRNRCVEIKTRLLDLSELVELVTGVALKENVPLSEKATGRIADMALGSPRRALVLLDTVVGVPPKEQMAALGKAEGSVGEVIELPRVLLKGARWKEVAEVLRRIKTEDAERVRRTVTGYCQNVLLGGRPNDRAMLILQAFREPVFLGFADVVAMAYDACTASGR